MEFSKDPGHGQVQYTREWIDGKLTCLIPQNARQPPASYRALSHVLYHSFGICDI